ncbi:MAG TPA: hypothetical protein VL048_11355 [Xanthobacteraceae bacterium]|nr:hypothetical protein [Xanthobacteraceae bacterium]
MPFLEDLRRAYSSLFVFDSLFTEPRLTAYWAEGLYFGPFGAHSGLVYQLSRGRGLGIKELETFIPLAERLTLQRVSLSSPGEWDFIGALNPLEVIRKSLNDHHERRKDREYREAAESERLKLENERLKTQVLREKVKLAKELGATDADLAPLLNKLVHEPLRALGSHQTVGLIDTAELTPEADNDGAAS